MKKNIKKPFLCKKFTLLELLVVIAIICILAGLLLPAFSKAKNMARDIKCRGQIRSLGQGSHMYANDYNEYMPARQDTGSAGFDYRLGTLDYIKINTGTFTCPMTRQEECNNNYWWRLLPNGSTAVINLCIAYAWGYSTTHPGPKITAIKLPGKMFFIGDVKASSSNAYVYYYGLALLTGNAVTLRHNGKYNFMMFSGDIQQRNDIANIESQTNY